MGWRKNNIDFDFERIQILSIPDTYKDKSQVLIIMALTNIVFNDFWRSFSTEILI